jgi:hypothetical protein
MTTRWARLARASVAASVAVFVAAFSHMLAGGTMPSALAMAACLGVCTVACIALTRRRLSLVSLSASVGVSQLLFHTVFSVWGSAAPASIRPSGHMMSMQLDATQLNAMTMATPHPTMSMDGWMWLAHLAAAVLTIAALRSGELAFWGILLLSGLWIGPLFSRLPKPAAPDSLRPQVVRPAAVLAPRGLALLVSFLNHRGPPLLAAASGAGIA